MANQSILSAFERFWQNTTNVLKGKSDVGHVHSANDITSDTLSEERLPVVPIEKGGTGAANAVTALENLGFTATVEELNIMDGVVATTAEINHLGGVTSNIQGQLDSKQPNITGAATTITSSDLDKSMTLVSDASGKVAVSDVTSTELGYLSGVTSGVQGQIDGKAPTSHASTSTTYGIGTNDNYGHVKLSDSTENTSDTSSGIAATPKAVKLAYDAAASAQEKADSAYELAEEKSAVGKSLEGLEVIISATEAVTAGTGAEIFNDYNEREFDSDGSPFLGNVASGDYSHAEGRATTASGQYSHAEGSGTTASGDYSHAEGLVTIASGDYSHAEGNATLASGLFAHAEGYGTTASGHYSHAEGYGALGKSGMAKGSFSHSEGYQTIADGDYSHAAGNNTSSLSNQYVIGHFNSDGTAGTTSGVTGDAFIIGKGSNITKSNAFRVTYAGKPYSCSSMTTTGADYAEFFEWQDLNPENEDRRGYFVTLDGEQIKIAEPSDYILGIVSALPAMIGNGDEDWRGRYILDDFGAFINEEFEYEEEVFDNETGGKRTVTKIGTRYKENPDYDPSQPYIQREDRPEWDAVGLVGVLAVRDDGTCQVNGFCKVAEGGIATASDSGYRVIKRINENIVKVVFR